MSEAAAFDGLAEEFFSAWFRFHPDIAVGVGVSGFGALLPAQSDDEVAALAAWLESLIVALEELDFDALDNERRIDAQLLFSLARVEHQELLERDWRHRDPLRFLPIAEIYHLTLRRPEDLRTVLKRLLERIPEYLRSAQTQLRSMAELVAPAMNVIAAQEAENGRSYLHTLVAGSWLRRRCNGCAEIEPLADQACVALAGFGAFLSSELAGRAAGRIDCGPEYLRFLLKHRHFLEYDPLAVCEWLRPMVARVEQELGELCATLGIGPQDASNYLSRSSISDDRRLESYRRECDGIEQRLRNSGLVTLPDVPLWIGERPCCPWPHRLGADYVADFDGDGGGTFLLNSERQSSELPGEPLAAARGRCLSSTWGGSHLFAFAGGDAGRRLARRVAHGGSLVGGWALYLRGRFSHADDADEEDCLYDLIQRRNALLWAQLELELHLGLLDQAQVGARLERDQLCDESGALVGLARLARHPGDATAAVLGWRLLEEARRVFEQREGSGFSELVFHDRIVAHGPIPLSLVLQLEFGQGFPRELGECVLS